MRQIRRSEERGSADYGWLKARYSFSFGDYYDPKFSQYHTLRVINEDRVAPGKGFPTHPHSNMEILTYIISGELAHKDSMGNGRTIKAGELQAMSAGSGVTHSEYNPSSTTPVHLLQIWITPLQVNTTPRYAEWKPDSSHQSALTLLASYDGRDGSVSIDQKADLILGQLSESENVEYNIQNSSKIWLQMISGRILIDSDELSAGDAISFSEQDIISAKALSAAKFLMFELF